METDILESVKAVGYSDLDEIALEKAVEGGAKSVDYTKLVEWLTKELQYLCSLDEHVNAISSADDSSSFQMELSSFLKEIGCNYSTLTTGHVNNRLQSKQNRLLLLDYLLTELKAMRMMKCNKPDASDELQVTLNESSTANELKNLLMILKFPKPPGNIAVSVLFNKVENTVKQLVKKVPANLIGKPMFKENLTGKQWHQLNEIQKELHDEYKIRRKTLLTRLDVSIRSFEWSDRLKAKAGDIEASYNMERKKMNVEPNVRLSDILAAREDLAITEKTSSASVRRKTKSDINYVVIGTVPDRGGRPYEQEPPPPEMPSWQQRSAGQSGNRGGGGQMGNRGGGGGQMGNRGGGGGQMGNRGGGGQMGNRGGGGQMGNRGGGGGQMGRGGGQMGRGGGQMGHGGRQTGFGDNCQGASFDKGNDIGKSNFSDPQPHRIQSGWNQGNQDRNKNFTNQRVSYEEKNPGYENERKDNFRNVGGGYQSNNTGYNSGANNNYSGGEPYAYTEGYNSQTNYKKYGGYQNQPYTDQYGQENSGYSGSNHYQGTSGHYQNRGRR